MPLFRRIMLLSAITLPPFIAVSCFDRRYPRNPISSLPKQSQIHALLNSPPENTHYSIVDIFTTTVPRSYFHSTDTSQEVSFHIWTNFLIKTEAVLLGSKPLPESPSSIKEHTNIARCNSIREPSYLFRFDIPGSLVQGIDCFAGRGYPWRSLHGGYHEVITLNEGDNVRIWYICAHEYGINDGKTLDPVFYWAHRLYARAILDASVRKLKRAM